jgi:hypothetical protein
MNLTKYLTVIIILAGIGIIVVAFIGSMPQLQITASLVGIGFICLGILLIKREQDRKRNEDKLDKIINKLDEIKQELEKKEESKGTGVAIADVIGAGMKYYAEHMSKSEKEEKKKPTG